MAGLPTGDAPTGRAGHTGRLHSRLGPQRQRVRVDRILTYNPKVASIYIFDRFTAFGLRAAVPAAVILLLVALAVFVIVRVLQPEDRR